MTSIPYLVSGLTITLQRGRKRKKEKRGKRKGRELIAETASVPESRLQPLTWLHGLVDALGTLVEIETSPLSQTRKGNVKSVAAALVFCPSDAQMLGLSRATWVKHPKGPYQLRHELFWNSSLTEMFRHLVKSQQKAVPDCTILDPITHKTVFAAGGRPFLLHRSHTAVEQEDPQAKIIP